MFVINETATQLFDRFFKFESDHESASAHFFDLREFLKFLQQVVTNLSRILYEILLFDDVHYGKSRRTSEVVSAKSRSQLSVYRFEHRAD